MGEGQDRERQMLVRWTQRGRPPGDRQTHRQEPTSRRKKPASERKAEKGTQRGGERETQPTRSLGSERTRSPCHHRALVLRRPSQLKRAPCPEHVAAHPERSGVSTGSRGGPRIPAGNRAGPSGPSASTASTLSLHEQNRKGLRQIGNFTPISISKGGQADNVPQASASCDLTRQRHALRKRGVTPAPAAAQLQGHGRAQPGLEPPEGTPPIRIWETRPVRINATSRSAGPPAWRAAGTRAAPRAWASRWAGAICTRAGRGARGEPAKTTGLVHGMRWWHNSA